MTGDDIHQILGNKTGHKGDTGTGNTENGIEDHGFPVAAAILINPVKLGQHFLRGAIGQFGDEPLKFFMHGGSPPLYQWLL